MRRAEITTLYEVVCERYPHLPHAVKGKLARVAERLLGEEMCDREACVRSINLAISETAAEYRDPW